MNKKSIKDIDIKGKKVLIRVDFNVPLDKKQNITDDTRIKEALPTIKYALENKAKLILMSHLGRPKGKIVEEMRLTPVAKRLSELLSKEVKKVDDCQGEKVKEKVMHLKEGEILLLENLRFHPEEEKNEVGFAQELANLAEVYVNDAFGTAHRSHASTVGVTKFLLSVAGFLLEKEIKFLGEAVEHPHHPFLVILGGAKVADKIGVIKNLLPKIDSLIIGGAMAYTFLKSKGVEIGKSKIEEDKLALAKEIMQKIETNKVKFLLPEDHLVAEEYSEKANFKRARDIPQDWIALDIGPETIREYGKEIAQAKTIIWNGPMGVFEMENFATGTIEIAECLAKAKATTIVGGGDSVAALKKAGVTKRIAHVSTGGGASLEFLEGKELPGIAALQNKEGAFYA